MSALLTDAPRANLRGVRPVRVALLGCGNIGGALARELHRADSGLEISAALVRDADRARAVPRSLLTSSARDVLNSRPDVVVECMGGIDEPASLCEQFLNAGIHVVSANKSMVAHALPALNAAARRTGANLRFDAAVCAGVPVLESVARLRAARVRSIQGIVNGTCNFILHAMGHGVEFQDALEDATARGYAEPDPTADLSGRDSAEKLCLLAAAAGLGMPHPQGVETRGLSGDARAQNPHAAIDRATLHDVRTLGHAVRLVAHLRAGTGEASLLVAPTVVPGGSALGTAAGTQNVVSLETELAGGITLCGPGAGAQPTVAALLADIGACADGHAGWAAQPLAPSVVAGPPERSRWLLRISAEHDARLTLTPAAIAAAVSSTGALWNGGTFLAGRALVQVDAPAAAEVALRRFLHARGALVQALVLAPGVTLRF